MKYLIFLIFASCHLLLFGQDEGSGYTIDEEKVVFLFDPVLYDVEPIHVVLTGAFRGWSQDMNDSEWALSKSGSVWKLELDNPNFSKIGPGTPFKFRIDNGQWMDPPAIASNAKGGNLIFMPDYVIPTLKAEIRTEHAIWADININRPLKREDYILIDAQGNKVPIAEVLPHDASQTLIYPAIALDKTRVYFLKVPSLGLKAHCSFDGWFRELYSYKQLGASIAGDSTFVRLFAPRAEQVKLYLYEDATDTIAAEIIEMQVDENRVWEVIVDRDLHGLYYDFTIHGPDEVGNYFYEKTQEHVNDPYARVSDDTWGKCRIWRNTNPATPLKNGIPKLEDVIAYEVHVQDFTDLLPVNENIKGAFPAMIQKGLVNSNGEKIGFDYLTDLGINTVHLMPVQEYLHFPTDDWKASFADDPYMIEQGVSEENYQWGYRTTFAMAVESRYRTKGSEPGTEREEFRDLVQAFHNEDIAVIIDIVPNHTGENMDGNGWFFNFNGIDQQYYYRTKDFEHIGAYGNEVKTENRPMVQRWLIDQCKHFIEEFGIDGFRIDLAGQIDEQTLKALRIALGPDIIIYGEAWIGSNDPDFEDNPDWDWYKEDAPITFFQDDTRNAFKGPVFELNDYRKDRGWPGGNFELRDKVMLGLANKNPDDDTPLSGISYLDIHDNFALADQFGGPGFDGRTSVDQAVYKIATTLLYTALGPIVTHGGSEVMRSKAHAPLGEVVKTTQAGHKVYMHGYRDTYNHRTANQFIWEQVGQGPVAGNTNDYKKMYSFWKGMNAFRLSEYGDVFRISEAVGEEYYEWIKPEDKSQLGYLVDSKVLVLLNAGKENCVFQDVKLPEGSWKRIASIQEVNHLIGVNGLYNKISGGSDDSHDLKLESQSLGIWVLE